MNRKVQLVLWPILASEQLAVLVPYSLNHFPSDEMLYTFLDPYQPIINSQITFTI